MADENGVLRIPTDDIKLIHQEALAVRRKEIEMREQFIDKGIPYEKLRQQYEWTKKQ